MMKISHETTKKKINLGNAILSKKHQTDQIKLWKKDYKNIKNFQTINVTPKKAYPTQHDHTSKYQDKYKLTITKL